MALGCVGSPYKPATSDAGTVYMEACLPCHQDGPNGPSLAGRDLTAEAVERRLARGGRGMPSFPGIRGEARTNLVAFVVRLSAREPGPTDRP